MAQNAGEHGAPARFLRHTSVFVTVYAVCKCASVSTISFEISCTSRSVTPSFALSVSIPAASCAPLPVTSFSSALTISLAVASTLF